MNPGQLAAGDRLVLGPWSRAASARNAGGTPGCGTADGAARRTRGHDWLTAGSSRARVPGIQLAGLRLGGKPDERPSQCQFGHETPVLAFALFAPAASRPGQHCAVRRRRWRQVAPCGHTSTVGQRFLRLVLRDRMPIAQRERKRESLFVFALKAQLGPLFLRATGAARCGAVPPVPAAPAAAPYSRVDRPPPAASEGK